VEVRTMKDVPYSIVQGQYAPEGADVCDLCGEPMEQWRGYIYGVHADCARKAIDDACNKERKR